jgi:hypothetical protein
MLHVEFCGKIENTCRHDLMDGEMNRFRVKSEAFEFNPHVHYKSMYR